MFKELRPRERERERESKSQQTSQSPQISILIPAYNTENYIEDCLKSVINQTFSDIEIIVANDASSDKTLEIINKYANLDKRIKIINNELNLGAALTRNVLLDNARGEYILFLDSDDYVDSSLVEKLYKKISSEKADLCLYGMYEVLDSILNLKDYNDARLFEINENLYFSHYETCLKCYKREFLDSLNLRFMDEYLFEDVIFSIKSFLNAKKIAILKENLYFYRVSVNNSETQRAKTSPKVVDIIEIIKYVENYLKEENLYNKYYVAFWRFALGQITYQFFQITDKEIKNNFANKANEFLESNNIYKIIKAHPQLKNGLYRIYPKQKTFLQNIFSIKNNTHFDKKTKTITILFKEFNKPCKK